MNKKADTIEFLMAYGWAILAAIIAIFLLWYFIFYNPPQELHFKITKEECENKTIYKDFCSNTRMSALGNLLGVARYYIGMIDECKANDCSNLKEFQDKLNKTYEEFDRIYDEPNPCIIEEEICEQIEVDRMEFIDEIDGFIITNAGVTIERLEKYCECVEGDVKEECLKNIKFLPKANDLCWDKEKNEMNMICNNNIKEERWMILINGDCVKSCTKYKCGEYTVSKQFEKGGVK